MFRRSRSLTWPYWIWILRAWVVLRGRHGPNWRPTEKFSFRSSLLELLLCWFWPSELFAAKPIVYWEPKLTWSERALFPSEGIDPDSTKFSLERLLSISIISRIPIYSSSLGPRNSLLPFVFLDWFCFWFTFRLFLWVTPLGALRFLGLLFGASPVNTSFLAMFAFCIMWKTLRTLILFARRGVFTCLVVGFPTCFCWPWDKLESTLFDCKVTIVYVLPESTLLKFIPFYPFIFFNARDFWRDRSDFLLGGILNLINFCLMSWNSGALLYFCCKYSRCSSKMIDESTLRRLAESTLSRKRGEYN